MRAVILIAFLGVALGAVVPKLEHKVNMDTKSLNSLITQQKFHIGEITPSDWLSDLIEQILGIKVLQLLNLINDTLVGSDKLIETAVTQLQKIILEVVADIKKELECIINDALAQALEIMQPILNQMAKILPSLNPKVNTTEVQPFDLVSDIILALLGITLEEFLTDITNALVLLTEVLNVTLAKLRVVAAKVSESVAQNINEVIESTLADTQALVKPLLEMLGQIFPVKNMIVK